MVLIYTNITSSRLQYTCSFIFKELIHTDFEITADSAEFEQYNGVKINYSNTKMLNSVFRVGNTGLLFEHGIKEQHIECFETNNYKAFFKTGNVDFPFDVFSAAFYLLSRYEEYLPHTKDMYGRYAHENSLAFKENFLQLPLINIWVKDFANELKKKSPVFHFQFSTFNFIPTYDIDIAYSYKEKGFARNFGGALKAFFSFNFSLLTERLAVLLNSKKDPFDAFDWMDTLHRQYDLKPLYFFLLAEKNGLYDKNILPHKKAILDLIKQHAEKYVIGIHPSWQSGDDLLALKKEKQLLETIAGKTITNSRQHYIRFNLPDGYRRLADIGITDDYSMGYGSINGFRASVATAFYWYDLEKDATTSLRIHPFYFMEANAYYEQKLSAEEAFAEMMYYFNACKEVSGTFISIWHNHSLGSDKTIYPGWNEIYKKFLAAVC